MAVAAAPAPDVRVHIAAVSGDGAATILGAALAALAATSSAATSASTSANGAQPESTAANLEVAILDRARAHRTFRRLQGPRLEELIAAARATPPEEAATEPQEAASGSDDPPTGPSSSGDGTPR